jgi:hypothetical protein
MEGGCVGFLEYLFSVFFLSFLSYLSINIGGQHRWAGLLIRRSYRLSNTDYLKQAHVFFIKLPLSSLYRLLKLVNSWKFDSFHSFHNLPYMIEVEQWSKQSTTQKKAFSTNLEINIFLNSGSIYSYLSMFLDACTVHSIIIHHSFTGR